MYETEEPTRAEWKIRAYGLGGVGLFLAGSAVMSAAPLIGLALYSGSLLMCAKATDLDKKYEDVLKRYEEALREHRWMQENPTLDAYA